MNDWGPEGCRRETAWIVKAITSEVERRRRAAQESGDKLPVAIRLYTHTACKAAVLSACVVSERRLQNEGCIEEQTTV